MCCEGQLRALLRRLPLPPAPPPTLCYAASASAAPPHDSQARPALTTAPQWVCSHGELLASSPSERGLAPLLRGVRSPLPPTATPDVW